MKSCNVNLTSRNGGYLAIRFTSIIGTQSVIPAVLGDMLGDDDDAKSERVMQAMLEMSKLDVRKLEKAYANV